MIKIILKRENGFYKSMEMSGHANYDSYGKDIVCSAASVLGITLINYFTEVVGIIPENYLLESEESEESSYLMIDVVKDYTDVAIQNGFKFYEIGIVGLIETYDNYIELIYQEV